MRWILVGILKNISLTQHTRTLVNTKQYHTYTTFAYHQRTTKYTTQLWRTYKLPLAKDFTPQCVPHKPTQILTRVSPPRWSSKLWEQSSMHTDPRHTSCTNIRTHRKCFLYILIPRTIDSVLEFISNHPHTHKPPASLWQSFPTETLRTKNNPS